MRYRGLGADIEDTLQLGDAYYFGPDRRSKRYADAPVQEAAICSRIVENIREASAPNRAVFSKDMAYYGTPAVHHTALAVHAVVTVCR